MAKTVTSMLVGIAIAEGHIRSVDDPAAAYVPALARHRVRTHIAPASAADVLGRALRRGILRAGRCHAARRRHVSAGRCPGGVDAVTPYNERAAPSGTRVLYASVETQVLGLVLTKRGRAAGRGLPAGEDLAADRRRGRCDLAHRPRGPGGDLSAASTPCCATTHGSACCSRTRATGAADRSFRRPGSRRPRPCARSQPHLAARRTGLRLRLSDLDLRGRAPDVRAARRPWPGDLRRSVQPARHGPHRGPETGPRSGRPGDERALAEYRAGASWLTSNTDAVARPPQRLLAKRRLTGAWIRRRYCAAAQAGVIPCKRLSFR